MTSFGTSVTFDMPLPHAAYVECVEAGMRITPAAPTPHSPWVGDTRVDFLTLDLPGVPAKVAQE